MAKYNVGDYVEITLGLNELCVVHILDVQEEHYDVVEYLPDEVYGELYFEDTENTRLLSEEEKNEWFKDMRKWAAGMLLT